MWKNKHKKRSHEEEPDDDDEVGEDGYRVSYNAQHSGCIPLDTVKNSEAWSTKVDRGNDPKKKYAVCFGYLGSAYQGLQINPNALTVEAVLCKALLLNGGIEECNYENPQKLGWTRAARTDRGVHAGAQLCAMKLRMPIHGETEFIDSLNRFLPDDIRAFDAKRVTKTFNSKISCSGRRYQYLFPTYLLEDVQTVSDRYSQAATDADKKLELRAKCIGYRLPVVKLTLLREALKQFEGTRKYHNFSPGKHPLDPSAQRYITSFTCCDPFVQGEEAVEWICISIEGQSFLLNQIRKMVALVFEAVRGAAPPNVFDFVFAPENKVDFLMAPGVGLYLGMSLFRL